MDTGRVIRAMYGISNSKHAKPQFKNRIMVRYGKAYAVNDICVLTIHEPFFSQHGLNCLEDIVENDNRYGFEISPTPNVYDTDDSKPWIKTKFDVFLDQAEQSACLNEFGRVLIDPVELAKVLRVFSAARLDPFLECLGDKLYVYAFDNSRDIQIECVLMGMR